MTHFPNRLLLLLTSNHFAFVRQVKQRRMYRSQKQPLEMLKCVFIHRSNNSSRLTSAMGSAGFDSECNNNNFICMLIQFNGRRLYRRTEKTFQKK
jgi:hypothetical protein